MNNCKEQHLEDFIEQTMFYKDIPGLAIAIVQGGSVIYSKGFGVGCITSQQPITPKTVFHTASITKTFVSSVILQLQEKGILDINYPVIQYLPYFKLKDERYKKITIKQMLSHTSAMADCQDYEWERPEYDDGALERYVRSLEDTSLLGNPGDKFRYSNIAYEVLGDVVAKCSGETFEDYVQRHVLIPLKMYDSSLLLQNIKLENLARPHIKNEEKRVVLSKVFPYNRKHGPSSTMYSNVLDISRWGLTILNRGILNNERILETSTVEEMFKPVAPVPGEEQNIGLGWFLSEFEGTSLIGHEGSDIGFRSSLGLLPDKKICATVLANGSYASTKKIMLEGLRMALRE